MTRKQLTDIFKAQYNSLVSIPDISEEAFVKGSMWVVRPDLLEDDIPHVRPFVNGQECWQEAIKHCPFGWVINGGVRRSIATFEDNYLVMADGEDVDFNTALECFSFIDGTPFGIQEDEQ